MSTRVRTTAIALSTVLVALLLMGAVLARNSSGEGAYRQLKAALESKQPK